MASHEDLLDVSDNMVDSNDGDLDVETQMPNVETQSPAQRLDKRVSVFGLIIGSACVLLSSTKYYHRAHKHSEVHKSQYIHATNYALASGILGVLGGAGLLLLIRSSVERVNTLVLPLVTGLVAIYWLIAACYMTFTDPFSYLGNGYISVWVTTFFAVALFVEVSPSSAREKVLDTYEKVSSRMMSAELNRRWTYLCAVASLVEVIQASIQCHDVCSDGGTTAHLAGYAVSAGVISIVVCVLLLVPSIPKTATMLLTFGLAVWWLIALIVLTFTSSFFSVVLINGYLGIWAAGIASIGMVVPYVANMGSMFEESQNDAYRELGDEGHVFGEATQGIIDSYSGGEI